MDRTFKGLYSPNGFDLALLIPYFIVMVILAGYGMHRYALVYMYYRNRKNRTTEPSAKFAELHRVTIQLPIYNEQFVVDRLVEAICKLDYPKDKLDIQVLDDSTDETVTVAQAVVDRYAALGHPITYIHRTNREGFKAGALQNGLLTAKGELVAIFDADFVPPEDWLMRVVHHFTDPKIGMVQTRWTHLNRNYSFLTEVEAFYHLSANLSYPLMIVLSTLLMPAMIIRSFGGWFQMLVIDLPLFLASTFSISSFYLVSQKELFPRRWPRTFLFLPFLMALGIGLTLTNTRAVIEALLGIKSSFMRTPKYRVQSKADKVLGQKYRRRLKLVPWLELLVGTYFVLMCLYAFTSGNYWTIPFLLLFVLGYWYTGLMSLLQGRFERRAKAAPEAHAKPFPVGV